WMHLSKPAQRERLKELAKLGRLGPDDRKHFKRYERFREVSEAAIGHTHQAEAPWHPIDATDRRHREMTAAKLLCATLEQAVAAAGAAPATPRAWVPGPSVLEQVDLSQRLTVAQYERTLPQLQERLSRLAWRARDAKVPTILAFEGWDAAGKGSAIRQALDPRLYRVVGIAAPTEE